LHLFLLDLLLRVEPGFLVNQGLFESELVVLLQSRELLLLLHNPLLGSLDVLNLPGVLVTLVRLQFVVFPLYVD